nr:nucleotide-binding alpha-beta plait domain-containing protein [Tanacetum cinerariifolium]
MFVTNFPDGYGAKDLWNTCKEGYANIELKYMGGFWVMIVFQDDETKKMFQFNLAVGSWFSQIIQAHNDFVIGERVIWVEVEGVPCWVPDFEEDGEEGYDVNDGSHEDDMHGGVSKSFKDVKGDSYREEVLETNFEEVPDKSIFEGNSVRQNDVHSEDLFGIYEEDGVCVGQHVHERVEVSNDTHESTCSGHFKKSEVPRKGGSILDLIDDLVNVGQTMRYDMTGCIKNMKEIIESQGAGSNPDETSEGQAGPDPGNAEARVQYTLSPVVQAGSDHEHMDLDVSNVSPQPSTEQLYEGFTATVYPNVQENLKLAVEEPMLLEEPTSSSGTLSSLQHLSRDFSFRDQFFSDKPSDADKSIETKVESMEHQQLKETTTDTTTTTATTLPPPQDPQHITTEAMMVKRIDAVDWAMQAPLRNRFRDLPKADIKEILHQRMWESDSYKSHKDHMQLFEALEKSVNHDHSEELAHDLAEARKKRKKGRESPKTPPGSPSHQPPPLPPPAGPSGRSGAPRASRSKVTPPPPPPTSTNQDSPSKGSAAPSPAKTTAITEHQAWSTPNVTLKLLVSLTPKDLDMDEAMGPDEQAQLSDEEDIRSAHIPTVNLRQGWWKPFEEE